MTQARGVCGVGVGTACERSVPWMMVQVIGLAAMLVVGLAATPAVRAADGSGDGAMATGPEYVAELAAWHAERIERLTGPSGWLTVVGLFWIEEGESTIGTDSGCDVVLPESAGFPRVAVLTLKGQALTIRPEAKVPVLLNDEPLTGETGIASDADGPADLLIVGDITFYVLERGSSYAVRVKDPASAERLAFHGVDRFPVRESYRVVADLVPYDPPRQKQVPTVIGTSTSFQVPGQLRFTLRGQECTLEPVLADEDAALLFIIFADATNGEQTYGAGRFLYAERERDGKVVLDFNRAVNPPCAFTRFATCPLPPPSNVLSIAVEAGEKRYGDH